MQFHYRKIFQGLLLINILLLHITQVYTTIPTYHLKAKKGDWVEYIVKDVTEPIELYDEINGRYVYANQGDKIKFEVANIGIEDVERRYDPGKTFYRMEYPICDIYLNGQKIARNLNITYDYTTPFVPFWPTGNQFWEDFKQFLENEKEFLETTTIETIWPDKFKYNVNIGWSNVTVKLVMLSTKENQTVEWTVHKHSGITLTFSILISTTKIFHLTLILNNSSIPIKNQISTIIPTIITVISVVSAILILFRRYKGNKTSPRSTSFLYISML